MKIHASTPAKLSLRSHDIAVWKALPSCFCLAFFLILTVFYNISGAEIKRPLSEEQRFEILRRDMVDKQISGRGVKHRAVLSALRKVPRHKFVPDNLQNLSYTDQPLPIGLGQTISQPYIVAFMTEAIDPKPGMKVLEIGTGSGYQAAVLSEIVKEVYSIEIIPDLAASAEARLQKLGYNNIRVRTGDGYLGWPEQAPFDAIIVTAAPEKIPEALTKQLALNGRMVIPVGALFQELMLVTKSEKGVAEISLLPVRFVPMIKGPLVP